ncbi:unnamed protein product, partial [Allacma fusca]
GFGRFQVFALFFIIYPELPAGTIAMLPVFVGGIPSVWNCTEDINNGVTVTVQMESSDICSCNGTMSGGTDSIVAQWNLVCDLAWVSDFITSLQMVGMFVGGFLGSQVADWMGRKKTLYASCLLILLAGAASGVSSSPFFYAATRFVIGFSIATYMVVGAIYPMEFFTPKYRSLSGTIGPWGEGVMLLALLAYLFPDWKTLSWISSLPMILVFISLPFLPESPRWLLRQGKVKEAKKVFDQIARWNGCEEVDDSVIQILVADLESEKKASDGKNQIAYVQLILKKKFFWKIITFMGIWFTCSLIFYGVGFGAHSLSGDVYMNVFYIGLVDALAYPASVPVMSWLGRRKALIGYCILAALPFIGIILMELGLPKSSVATVALTLVSRVFVDGCWSTIRCFTGESFPTSVRSSAVGLSQVAVAVGGIIAPQIVFLGRTNPAIPYFIFGGFSVVSSGLSFFLRETKGKPIAEHAV